MNYNNNNTTTKNNNPLYFTYCSLPTIFQTHENICLPQMLELNPLKSEQLWLLPIKTNTKATVNIV